MVDYKKWRANAMKDPEFRKLYEEPDEDPFVDVALKIIKLRQKKHLTQTQLARKIHTSQQAIARLESLKYRGYSLETLGRIAEAFDKRLLIRFV